MREADKKRDRNSFFKKTFVNHIPQIIFEHHLSVP